MVLINNVNVGILEVSWTIQRLWVGDNEKCGSDDASESSNSNNYIAGWFHVHW